MKIIISNNHIVVPMETNIGTKNVLLDTGAGQTVRFDRNITEFRTEDGVFKPNGRGMLADVIDPQAINNLVGMNISAILGPDFFKGKTITIDFKANEITFNEPMPENASPIDINTSLLGLPVLEMKINGHALRTAFDTGARYSFVESGKMAQLGLGNAYGTFKDYSPMFGDITADLHKCDLTLGTCQFADATVAACGDYDKAAALVRVQAFLGIDPFVKSGATLWISYPDKKMAVVK